MAQKRYRVVEPNGKRTQWRIAREEKDLILMKEILLLTRPAGTVFEVSDVPKQQYRVDVVSVYEIDILKGWHKRAMIIEADDHKEAVKIAEQRAMAKGKKPPFMAKWEYYR